MILANCDLVTPYGVVDLDGLSPVRQEAISWTNDQLLSIGPFALK